MHTNIYQFKTINEYLAAAGCKISTNVEGAFIMKFTELNKETVIYMQACQKDFYQINFITKAGKGTYWFNAHKKAQTEDTIYFISPEHVYSWIRDEQLQGYLLYFKKNFLNFYKGSIENDFIDLFDVCYENCLILPQANQKHVLALFQMLHTSYHSINPFRIQVLRATILNLLFYLKHTHAEYHKKAAQTNRNSKQFIAYKNLVNNLFLKLKTVNDYASLLNISPNYLNAICKLESHKTAKEIIQDRLLEEAEFLILFTEKDIAEIAFHLGFSEPTHFSRFFKNTNGQSPQRFRAANR
ncbi:MAG: AraC family transcriptional regulator [Bacteroidota bacterium]